MYQFLESICCIDGKIQNLELHQDRVDNTSDKYFNSKPIALRKSLVGLPIKGKYKCRIVYSTQIESIDFLPYKSKDIKSLKIIEADNIDYEYKFLDRKSLEKAFLQKGDADDIIISKGGVVTDAYFANLLFFDGENWYTPVNPLLKGTKRELLLKSNEIIEKEIETRDIQQYEKVSLINAMLDLSEVEIDINCIY
jgi:4-amino-4-deoxychorismate lyase